MAAILMQLLKKAASTFISSIWDDRVPNSNFYERSEGADSLTCISHSKLVHIDQWLESHPVELLRAPPSSGKTTFAETLYQYYKRQNREVLNVGLLGFIYNRESKFRDFKRFWKSYTGKSWSDCIKCQTPLVIIIDEAQVLYQDMEHFWTQLKKLKQAGTRATVRILLLSMYGELGGTGIKTPIDFETALGLDVLRLKDEEYTLLIKKFIEIKAHTIDHNRSRIDLLEIPAQIKKTIYHMCQGHVGLIRRTLTLIWEQYRSGIRDEDGFLKFLLSPRYRNTLRDSRSCFWVHDWKPSPKQSRFLREILYQCDKDSTFTVDLFQPEIEREVNHFVRCGLLIYSGNSLQFTAPLMRMMLSQLLFSSPWSASQSPSVTHFEEFVIRSIERMNSSVLKETLGVGYLSRRHERTWQMEWYRSACSIIPKDSTISADVGYVFGAKGFLDFYISGNLQWGIELLCEGRRLAEHMHRFSPEGRYSLIPLKNWAVIDFRNQAKKKQEPEHPNLWYAYYDGNFTKITIYRQGRPPLDVFLQGEVSSQI